jgi:hypothetical protein
MFGQAKGTLLLGKRVALPVMLSARAFVCMTQTESQRQ